MAVKKSSTKKKAPTKKAAKTSPAMKAAKKSTTKKATTKKSAPAYQTAAFPAFRYAAIVNRESPVNTDAAWQAFFALKSKRDLPGGPATIFAADKSWYAVVFSVTDKAKIEAPFEEIRLVAGKWLVCRYTGPLDGLRDAWSEFAAAVGGNGVDAGRPLIESYRDDGSADGKPITDLFIPVT